MLERIMQRLQQEYRQLFRPQEPERQQVNLGGTARAPMPKSKGPSRKPNQAPPPPPEQDLVLTVANGANLYLPVAILQQLEKGKRYRLGVTAIEKAPVSPPAASKQ